MKKKLALMLALMLIISALAGCTGGGNDNGNEDEMQPENTGTAEHFSVSEWLDDPDNAMMFGYIAVDVYPDVWDKKAGSIGTITADEDAKDSILDKLNDVIFTPAEQLGTMHSDFAFAMNEPFLFFAFTDKGLMAKVPADSAGYDYFEALYDDYPGLNDLYDYIAEMRLAYDNQQ